ncbi:MAG TPA: MoaD/ThiS family protein [Nitrososphaerales archaeon]|nr:MoaD/ThiS family protein [Nitrososphaerales archaeon]
MDERIGRRKALKTIAIIAATGTGIAMFGGGGMFELFTHQGAKSPRTATPSHTNVTATVTPAQQNSSPLASGNKPLQTIKVIYFGMATQTTGTKQEYYSLASPAYFDDLMSQVREKHVVLAPMLSTMQVVVNGNPVEGNPILNNNDEVDFIPILAGG